MSAKKSVPLCVFICVAVFIVYIFVGVRPLGYEYQFVPDWTIDVHSGGVSASNSEDNLIYFKLGQTMGYFTSDGRLSSFLSFPFRASISENYYAPYNSSAQNVTFYKSDGNVAGNIKSAGFPFFDDDRIFVFLPGGNAFAFCNDDGSTSWTYRGTVPITAFDSCEAGCVAGFADGTVRSFTYDGKQDCMFAPGGSNFPVILGVAISPSGKLATVCGRERQRFVLAQKDGAQAKIVSHFFLEKDDPYQKLVRFSDDGTKVYYCIDGSVGVANVDGSAHGNVSITGRAISIREAEDGVFVLSKDGSNYTVTFIENFATKVAAFSFEARTAFIQVVDNMLFVGKDETISRVSILKD